MFAVMLAKSAPATTDTINMLTGTHYFDLKIDGVRDVIAINKGTVRIQNRNGVDTTNRYPDIVAGCLAQFGPDAQLVLDGEMVVKVDGRPDFKATSQRDRCSEPAKIAARSKSMPATFIAFDILYADGMDYRNDQYIARKERLDVVMGKAPAGVVEKNVGSMDGHALMALVREHHLEGVIAKRLTSRYKAGKGTDWLKIKPTFMLSAVVTGFTAGEGARSSTFGALSLGLWKDGVLTPVGEVGTGFKQNDLLEVQALLASGQTLVVEVEYQEFTVDGSLRFPVYRGIRSDVDPATCLYSQTDKIVTVTA
jgi:bifunctional non-homologous end joining protein LigD